jgi:riboflavin synthase
VVQGHVDCTARIVDKHKDGSDALWVWVELPAAHSEVMDAIVSKGYVAIDGTSLTVCGVDVERRRFSFMLIPHTQRSVAIPHKGVGECVNVETDIVGKMIVAAMGRHRPVQELGWLGVALGGAGLIVASIALWRSYK